jgi:hypothetical protein
VRGAQDVAASEVVRRPVLDGTPLEDPSGRKEVAGVAARTPGSPIDLSTVEIRLDRTECYGSCPNYSVVILGNGHVRYIGRTFVKVVGEQEATLPESALCKLLDEFGRVNFANLRDEYRESVTDCQTTVLTLRLGDHTKRVENYWAHGAFDDMGIEVADRGIHEQLDFLADVIDEAVGIERWIGTLDEHDALRGKFEEGYPGRMEPK